MKKYLLCSAAIALLLGTAYAAPGDNDQDQNRPNQSRGNGPSDSRGNGPMAAPGAGQGDVNRTPPRSTGQTQDNRMNRDRSGNDNRSDMNRSDTNRSNANRSDMNRSDRNTTTTTRATMERRNVDLTKFRRNVKATRRFHIAVQYNPPSGYHYRRWSYGQRLPSAYYARNYWLTDYLTFGLFAPPLGYVWVRYGDDALLIDEYTGEIVQVQYGIFY